MHLATFLFILSTCTLENPVEKNPNREFIEREKAKLDLMLKKCSFEDGHIFMNGDSLKMPILKFKGKYKNHGFLMCIVRPKADSIAILSADDIDGYQINQQYFMKWGQKNGSFFVREISRGRIQLFEKEPIPTDPDYLYFFAKEKREWYVLNPFGTNFKFSDPGKRNFFDPQTGQTSFTKLGIGEKFKQFFSDYTSDCQLVTNGIKSEFFSITDLELVVKSYNKCQ